MPISLIMRRLIFITISAFILIQFQNCSKHDSSSSDSVSSTSGKISNNQEYDLISTKEFRKLVLWDHIKAQFVDLNLDNGKMIAYEEYGSVRTDQFCLTSEELQKANQIMSASDICDPKVSLDEPQEVMCSMMYVYPYVTLISPVKELKLGEMTSGCDKPTDLCGENAAKLKEFVSSVISSLELHKCEN